MDKVSDQFIGRMIPILNFSSSVARLGFNGISRWATYLKTLKQ